MKQKQVIHTANCLTCGNQVVQNKKRSMLPCSKCGEVWNFTINDDGSAHLYHCKPRKDKSQKAMRVSVSVYPQEIALSRKAGFSNTQLQRIGYQVAVLGMAYNSKIV